MLLSACLGLTIVIVYWGVRKQGFMQIDDYLYVVDNVHTHQGLSWSTIKWAFTAMDMVNWIPLTWLAHAFDYQLFGATAAGHHLANVALHALAALLLFWTLTQATGYMGRSFMVAALFALHPINVEAVAWVAELKTMLSMIFFLLTLLAYRWYAGRPGLLRYSLVTVLYACGLMAKSQIIMLPLVLLLWDFWPLQRMRPSGSETVPGTNALTPFPPRDLGWLIKEKLPLFAIALLDGVITLHVQSADKPARWEFPFGVRLANALVAYVRYLGKAGWPQGLAIYYPHPGHGIPLWKIAGASALLLGVTIAVLRAWRQRYLAVGWLWFLISLFPMIGILHFGHQAMADRYAYQPFCGLYLMVCWGVAEWSARRHLPPAVLPSAGAILFVALAALTCHQVGFWRDDLTLWTHALQVEVDNPITEDRIGGDLLELGREAEALPHFARAISLDPADVPGNLQLGFYEHKHGNFRVALAYYQRVVQAPEVNDQVKRRALINMGHVYGKLGDPDQARRCFDEAAAIAEQ